ncbi:MAG TPA: AAA family ATPase, partial [Kofleriaceae bacterium]|nr:AAA family ATPase [Kofleriaceae bacterium]
MYITEIELSNLRCFQGTHKVSLDRGDGTYAGWTVFAGRNGSGKSTLLKAIAAAVAGPLAVRSLEGSVPNWLRERSGSAHVKVRVQSSSEDRLRRKSSPRSGKALGVFARPPRVELTLRWWKLGSGAPFFVPKSHPQAKVDQGPWHDGPDGWFLAAYGPYRRLGPVTADIAKVSNDPKLARLINLFREEATLSDAVDWLKEQHARSL